MILANSEKANRNTISKEYDRRVEREESCRSVEVSWWKRSERPTLNHC
jgi:hypothetical protein